VLNKNLHIFFAVKTSTTIKPMKTENQPEKNNLLSVIFFITILNLLICLITQAFFAYGFFRDELYYMACAGEEENGTLN